MLGEGTGDSLCQILGASNKTSEHLAVQPITNDSLAYVPLSVGKLNRVSETTIMEESNDTNWKPTSKILFF